MICVVDRGRIHVEVLAMQRSETQDRAICSALQESGRNPCRILNLGFRYSRVEEKTRSYRVGSSYGKSATFQSSQTALTEQHKDRRSSNMDSPNDISDYSPVRTVRRLRTFWDHARLA